MTNLKPHKPRLVIMAQHFEPAFKAGGPVRSIANLIYYLNDEFDVTVVTSDRDCGDTKPFENIKRNQVQTRHGVNVIYLSPRQQNPWCMMRWLRWLNAEVIYLNSFFSPRFAMSVVLLSKLNLLKGARLVQAPRGELSDGALSLRKNKKQLYLKVARILGLYQKVKWHASSDAESHDIQQQLGEGRGISVAGNLTAPVAADIDWPRKTPGHLKLVFLSRISRKKQLDFALNALSQVKQQVTFDIYGPLEDQDYWHECGTIINNLTSNIKVNYQGKVLPAQVRATLSQYDALILPTLNENYGHVIFEALAAGCPPILSPHTPWNDIEDYGAGWVRNLDTSIFAQTIDALAGMDDEEFRHFRHSAQSHAFNHHQQQKSLIERYRTLFKPPHQP